MPLTITPADVRMLVKVPELLEDAKAQYMIDTAMSRARLLAPCLAEDYSEGDALTEDELNVIRDTIMDAIVRWVDGARGIVQTEAKGEYSQTIRQNTLGLFRPNEIRELQSICKGAKSRGKASTTVVGFPYAYGDEPNHAAWCSWNFDPDRLHNRCDCGAILTASGEPLY
ncbi:head-to-tail adaptor [Gordonia phage GiKK]|nr:head-to-tail adaptor [Gordonia phage GiKK]UVK63904.1 head-to-tail adaptor [Gordonia phage Button]